MCLSENFELVRNDKKGPQSHKSYLISPLGISKHCCVIYQQSVRISHFSASQEGTITPSYFSAPVAFYITCTPSHSQDTGDTGILRINEHSRWVNLSAMNSLPFHVKEAESVSSLKTQLTFFFFSLHRSCSLNLYLTRESQLSRHSCEGLSVFNYREFSPLLEGI